MNVPVLLFSLAAAVVHRAHLRPRAGAADGAAQRRRVAEGLRQGRQRRIPRAAGCATDWSIAEVALSLTLLAGAGLLMRSFVVLQRVDLGLNPDNILVARLPLPRGQYDTAAGQAAVLPEAARRGCTRCPASSPRQRTSTLPPYGGIGSEIEIPGKTPTERWDAIFQLCSEGYQPTLGLRLVRGRFLSESEVNAARGASRSSIRPSWTSTSARRIRSGSRYSLKLLETMPNGAVENALFEIIGVMSDAKNNGIQRPGAAGSLHPLHDHRCVRAGHPRANGAGAGGAPEQRAERDLGASTAASR